MARAGLTLTVMLGMISMIMTSTMVNVAIPDIMGAFGIGQDQAHWMATGFLAAMTTAMLTSAWLVNRFGARNVFLGAVAVFCMSAVLGQLSPSFFGVVVARIAQGACAGLIQPLAMGSVFLAYPPHERGKAMGWFGMGIVLGPAIGPVLGGVIVDTMSWRYTFGAAVPVIAIAAVLAGIYLPGRDENAERRKFNLPSFVLITAAIFLFLNAITNGHREGWAVDGTFFMLLGSVSAFIIFLVRESQSSTPLINVKLFAYPTFVASAVVAFMFGAGMFGSIYLTPVMVQTVQGFTATKAGFLLLPGSIAAMMMFPIAGRLAQNFPPRNTIVFGLLTFAISCYWLARVDMLAAFWTLAWMIAVGRVGLGLVVPSLNLGAMSSVPRELVPYATSTLNFIRMTGASIGVNALAILLDARIDGYRANLSATQTPDNVKTMEVVGAIADRLEVTALTEIQKTGVALSYLNDVLHLKASELAFHDGFMALVIGFVLASLTTVVLLRHQASVTEAFTKGEKK